MFRIRHTSTSGSVTVGSILAAFLLVAVVSFGFLHQASGTHADQNGSHRCEICSVVRTVQSGDIPLALIAIILALITFSEFKLPEYSSSFRESFFRFPSAARAPPLTT